MLVELNAQRNDPFFERSYKLVLARTIAGKLVHGGTPQLLEQFIASVEKGQVLPAAVLSVCDQAAGSTQTAASAQSASSAKTAASAPGAAASAASAVTFT